MRNTIIKTVTFIAGLYFILEFLLPESLLVKVGLSSNVHENVTRGVILVGSMALGLGIINLLLQHGSKIVFRRRGWFDSLALLFGLFLMMSITFLDWKGSLGVQSETSQLNMLSEFARKIVNDAKEKVVTQHTFAERLQMLQDHSLSELNVVQAQATARAALTEAGDKQLLVDELGKDFTDRLNETRGSLAQLQPTAGEAESNFTTTTALITQLSGVANSYSAYAGALQELSLVKRIWRFLFDGLFVALGSAMFSLLGVYIASAAYRAFRVKSLESALMMVSAVIVMLGQIPFGISVYEHMPTIRQWLLETPNSAAFRAIALGAAVAGVVMSFRMWLSLESEYNSRR